MNSNQRKVNEINAEIEELKKKIKHLKKEKLRLQSLLHPAKSNFLEYNKDNNRGEKNV